MSERCFDDAELGEVLERGERHPRHAHLTGCPRCRSRLADYRAFTSAAEVPGANLADAERRLGAALAARLGGGPSAAAPALARGPLATLLAAFGARSLRPALAFAGIVVVVAGAWFALRLPPPARERGSVVPGAAAFRLEDPRPVAAGLELRWSAIEGAEAYEVRFAGPDLADLARSGPQGATHWVLRRDALPAGLMHGRTVIWQVVALRFGQPLATSGTGTLVVP